MRKYVEFGAWVLGQAHRDDRFGEVSRLVVALNDPIIATKHRDDLYVYLRDVHHIAEDILWFIDFDMYYDEWIDSAGYHAQNGVVYLLRAGSHYKIGITQQEVVRRIAALQTANPEPIVLVAKIDVTGIGDSVVRWEKYFHGRFAPARRTGEWFLLSDDEVGHFNFISRYYDYIYQNVGRVDITEVDSVIREITETNTRNASFVGKRVYAPRGTPVVSEQWEPLSHGIIGRVVDWSDDPFWPSVCIRNKSKDYWVDSKDVVTTS